MTAVYDAALAAHEAGLCVVPVAGDGSKRPRLTSWQRYQRARPTLADLGGWFDGGKAAGGLGLVCGAVGGDLEMLEFEGRALEAGLVESTLDAFLAAASTCGLGDLVARIRAGYEELTPAGGLHWLYRCTGPVGGNLKLASQPGADGLVDVLIETRGEGGYTVVAPSSGTTHPSGRPWQLVGGGGFGTIATISADERRELLDLARSFDAMPARVTGQPSGAVAATGEAHTGAESPVDDFNARADWATLLVGWAYLGERGQTAYWRRPGKDRGVSATTNHLGTDRLKVFSSSTPFDPEATYSKYGAWCVLNGFDPDSVADRNSATKSLAGMGYGKPYERQPDNFDEFALDEADEADEAAWKAARPDLAGVTPKGELSGVTEDGEPWEWADFLDVVLAGAQAIVAESGQGAMPPVIPSEWWDRYTAARPWLAGVQEMAVAREMANPDSLLVTTITRAVAAVDWRIRTPNVGQGAGTLNLHTYTAAASGGGKGAGNSGARALVPETVAAYGAGRGGASFIEAGLGSGEGITKAFWGEELDPSTGKNVAAQTERNVLFIEEEGGSLDQLAARSGVTLPENLRKTFMGEGIRPSNRSHIEKLQPSGYRMGLLLNIQTHLAGSLFEDRSALGGTLQRVLWAAASSMTDLPAGELPPLPPEPAPLGLLIPSVSDRDAPARDVDGFTVMTADKAVSDAYRRRMRCRDAWTAHEPYIVVKLASLFALIAGRWHVHMDDWHMACGIVDYSAEVRGWVHEQVRAENRRKAQAATHAHMSREVETDQAKAQAHAESVERVARGLIRHVAKPSPGCLPDGCRRRCVSRSVCSSDRGLLAEAYALALEDGRMIDGADGTLTLGVGP